jgi:hypothetical protein
MDRKYIVHVSGTVFIGALIFYASTCNPLLPHQIVEITKQLTGDPACLIQSYKIEAPELPQHSPLPPIKNIYAITASGTTTSFSPSPSFGIDES